MKVLNFGSCNVDHVYSLDHIVAPGETEASDRLELFPGGKGLNQSIAIAKAGVTVQHAGCVGNGSFMLVDLLKKSNVDIFYLKKIDTQTGHAVIQVDKNGKNSIFTFSGANAFVSKEYIDEVLNDFSAGDFLVLQNEISNVDYLVEQASAKQMTIVFNPSPFNDAIKQIDFQKLTYLILNETEMQALTDRDNPEEGLSFLKNTYPDLKVVLTLGEGGSILLDQAQEIRQPSFCVDVVDTTAAGDTFTGYFVAELSRGSNYARALKIASAASALAVSRMGAAPSIPERNEVLSSLSFLKPREVNRRQDLLRKQIEDYMDAHLTDGTLRELAYTLGYSPIYMGALVKRMFDVSFSQALQNKRCEKAAHLLLSSSLPISAIIHQVGYENESFFRKIFREKYQKTPLQFRNRKDKSYVK